jgi:hypothetical protein
MNKRQIKQIEKAGYRGTLSFVHFMGILNGACGGIDFEKLDPETRIIVEKKLELFAKAPKERTLTDKLLGASFSVMIIMATLLGSVWCLILLFKLVGIGQ